MLMKSGWMGKRGGWVTLFKGTGEDDQWGKAKPVPTCVSRVSEDGGEPFGVPE